MKISQGFVAAVCTVTTILSIKAQEIVIITEATEPTPVTLNCTNSNDASYIWFYNGAKLTTRSGILKITDSEKVGEYQCISTVNRTYQASNFSAPVIGHGEKSVTVIDGTENVVLKCKSRSFPTPSLYWMMIKDGITKNISRDPESNFNIKTDGVETELTILSVAMDSRADYGCVAENIAGKKNTTTLLRVRSTLAPLWPFLAILAEVVAMAIITLIFHRRAKDKSGAIPAPTEPVNRNNEAHGSGPQQNAKED